MVFDTPESVVGLFLLIWAGTSIWVGLSITFSYRAKHRIEERDQQSLKDNPLGYRRTLK